MPEFKETTQHRLQLKNGAFYVAEVLWPKRTIGIGHKLTPKVVEEMDCMDCLKSQPLLPLNKICLKTCQIGRYGQFMYNG